MFAPTSDLLAVTLMTPWTRPIWVARGSRDGLGVRGPSPISKLPGLSKEAECDCSFGVRSCKGTGRKGVGVETAEAER